MRNPLEMKRLVYYEWDVKGIDFSNFQGSVVLSGTEEFAAIVILVRPPISLPLCRWASSWLRCLT